MARRRLNGSHHTLVIIDDPLVAPIFDRTTRITCKRPVELSLKEWLQALADLDRLKQLEVVEWPHEKRAHIAIIWKRVL
jgi:hypothetical protein